MLPLPPRTVVGAAAHRPWPILANRIPVYVGPAFLPPEQEFGWIMEPGGRAGGVLVSRR